MNKYHFIGNYALDLIKENRTMTGSQLATTLNSSGYETSYGTQYEEHGGRGIHKLIASAYYYFKENNNEEVANAITLAFVDKDNEFAWDK